MRYFVSALTDNMVIFYENMKTFFDDLAAILNREIKIRGLRRLHGEKVFYVFDIV